MNLIPKQTVNRLGTQRSCSASPIILLHKNNYKDFSTPKVIEKQTNINVHFIYTYSWKDRQRRRQKLRRQTDTR